MRDVNLRLRSVDYYNRMLPKGWALSLADDGIYDLTDTDGNRSFYQNPSDAVVHALKEDMENQRKVYEEDGFRFTLNEIAKIESEKMFNKSKPSILLHTLESRLKRAWRKRK